MAHLGRDIAAYVDGQLPESALQAADAHLETCADCDRAVRQQRLLKSRVSTGAVPGPPPDLIAALAGLETSPPEPITRWARVKHAAPLAIAVALAGASLTVIAVAYVVGGANRADIVTPGFDELAMDFYGSTPTTTAATFTAVDPNALDAQGWPCHEELGNLERTSAGVNQARDTVLVTYTDGTRRLRLYQQAGRLNHDDLSGFEHTEVGTSSVWMRADDATVMTWDRDGVVYTIVTDVDATQLPAVLDTLPREDLPNPLDRIGEGIHRLGDWATAA